MADGALGAPDDEQVCEEQRAVFFEEIVERREESSAVRAELLERLTRMREQYAETAPVCYGRLQEHAAFLYIMEERFEELVTWVGEYLRGPGVNASVRSRIGLHNNRGYALRRLGRTVEGAQESFYAASLADQAEAVHGARALIVAGYAARKLGEEGPAIRYFQSALQLISDSIGRAPDPELLEQRGSALTSLSILTNGQVSRAGSDSERDSLIDVLDQQTRQALDVLSSQGQSAGHRAHASNLSAMVAAWRGDMDLARERMRSSRLLSDRAGMWMPFALWSTYITEGRIAELADDYGEARAAFERARQEAIRGRNAPNEATALDYLGRLDERAGDWQAASANYQASIERREILRDRLGLDDWSASSFGLTQSSYRGLARVRLATGDAVGAFSVLDQTRARYLRDLRLHLDIRSRLQDDSRIVVDSLANRLSDARQAALVAETVAETAALRSEISTIQQEMERITALDATEADAPLVDVPALQRHLAEEERTLISYMIDDEESFAFVVRPDTLVAVPIPATHRRIREHFQAIGSPWNGRAPDAAFALSPLHALYQDLIAPLRSWVSTPSVTIVPDGDLAMVPFSIFLTAPAEDYENAPYLLREWTITTELAAALITTPALEEERTIDILALGRSRFDQEGSTWNTEPLGDLPNVHEEIRRVSRHGVTQTYEDEEATEDRFRAEANKARVIHLASHAEARPELPLYSRIALDSGEREDGILHLYEILNTPLHADLVVLSGCSTARGGQLNGEGLIGLQYGMRAAGAGATIATLWPVADEATADLMGTFYEGLAEGLDKDEALRQAQIEYLESHEGLTASPFYWAAPVLSGSPAPVPFQSSLPWGWVAVMVAATAGWLAWRYRTPPGYA